MQFLYQVGLCLGNFDADVCEPGEGAVPVPGQGDHLHAPGLGRYGGEEFTVMLPNTLKDDALQVAERIRSNIENMDFEYEGKKVKVTISGGVSVFDIEENCVLNAKEFVEQADKALYVSKTSGRNRITFADKSIIDSDVKTEN